MVRRVFESELDMVGIIFSESPFPALSCRRPSNSRSFQDSCLGLESAPRGLTASLLSLSSPNRENRMGAQPLAHNAGGSQAPEAVVEGMEEQERGFVARGAELLDKLVGGLSWIEVGTLGDNLDSEFEEQEGSQECDSRAAFVVNFLSAAAQWYPKDRLLQEALVRAQTAAAELRRDHGTAEGAAAGQGEPQRVTASVPACLHRSVLFDSQWWGRELREWSLEELGVASGVTKQSLKSRRQVRQVEPEAGNLPRPAA